MTRSRSLAPDSVVAPVTLKRVELALNIQTFINLYGYGYRNVYELAPLVALADSNLEWEGK